MQKSTANSTCSGRARQRGCQPTLCEPHIAQSRNGYRNTCCSSRASQGAKKWPADFDVMLACMLFAYNTLERAT